MIPILFANSIWAVTFSFAAGHRGKGEEGGALLVRIYGSFFALHKYKRGKSRHLSSSKVSQIVANAFMSCPKAIDLFQQQQCYTVVLALTPGILRIYVREAS